MYGEGEIEKGDSGSVRSFPDGSVEKTSRARYRIHMIPHPTCIMCTLYTRVLYTARARRFITPFWTRESLKVNFSSEPAPAITGYCSAVI
jgi:hypothetical protein